MAAKRSAAGRQAGGRLLSKLGSSLRAAIDATGEAGDADCGAHDFK
jgi:hypothetical protein